MARTKQTARKSTGGKAPRKAAVARFAAQRIQQQTGSSAPVAESELPEVIHFDVSHESSFYAHYFKTEPTTKTFHPNFSLARSSHPLTKEEELFLTVSFSSKLDGEGIKKFRRPQLNLVLALDISGSMSLPFSGEKSKSKIQVAKDCILALIDHLQPEDRFGLILFNQKATIFQPIDKWGNINSDDFKQKLDALRAGGGTEISPAIIKATEQFKTVPEDPKVSNRVFFLTDMEVDDDDGRNFTDLVAASAKKSIWSTVVGIGLDLTGDIITRVSSTAGCNYSNVRSSAYFREFVESEFDYSVTAIAFNICVELVSQETSISAAYGSYELRGIPAGSKQVFFSTEFPSRKNAAGEARGGVLLFKLDPKKLKAGSTLDIKTTWENANGLPKANSQTLTVPSSFDHLGIRKAVLLHHYASFLRQYVDLRHETSEEGFKTYTQLRKSFPSLYHHFKKEMGVIGDSELSLEVNMLEQFSKDDDIPLGSGASKDCDDETDMVVETEVIPTAEDSPSLKRKLDFDSASAIPELSILQTLDRYALQLLAKQNGIRANTSNQTLITDLSKKASK